LFRQRSFAAADEGRRIVIVSQNSLDSLRFVAFPLLC